MLLILVPTGFTNYTVTASGQRPVIYRCCSCGATQVHLAKVEANSTGQYHFLNSRAKKDDVRDRVQEAAGEALAQRDELLARLVNDEHEYGYVGSHVTCPACGREQPWSLMPKPWRKEEHDAWNALLVMFGLLAAITVLANLMSEANRASGVGYQVAFTLGGIAPVAALLAYRFWYVRRHDRVARELSAQSFEPPVYVSQSMAESLKAARAAGASHVATSTGRYCTNCGAPLADGARFCVQCGAPARE
ncbi:zinc ribbon domain-containing protein [Thermophilibacter sp.]